MYGLKLHCFNFELAFIHVHNDAIHIATGARDWIDFSPQKCPLMLKKRGRCRIQAFQQNWTSKYLFTEVGGKAVC